LEVILLGLREVFLTLKSDKINDLAGYVFKTFKVAKTGQFATTKLKKFTLLINQ